MISKTLHRAFDRVIIRLDRNSTRHRWRELSPRHEFDERAISPAEFFEETQHHFEHPEPFFLPSDMPAGGATLLSEARDRLCTTRELYLPSPRPTGERDNDRIHCTYIRSNAGDNRTCLVFLTGWVRDDTAAEIKFCRWFARHGIDTILVSPPYSQRRTPRGWKSGEYFITPDILQTAANIRQAVADIVSVLHWLEREGVERRWLVGLSVGGMLASLAADVYPADGLVLMMAGGDLAGVIFTGRETVDFRQELESHGVDRETLGHAWAVCDPLHLAGACKVARDRILMFTTKFDEVVPTDNQEELWRALGEPMRESLACAHYSIIFKLRGVRKQIRDFVKAA